MSPEMHEQCGAYCYQTFKPVLEHVVQLTEEVARKDEEIKKAEKFVEVAKNNAFAISSRFLDAFGKDVRPSLWNKFIKYNFDFDCICNLYFQVQSLHIQLSTKVNPSQNSKP